MTVAGGFSEASHLTKPRTESTLLADSVETHSENAIDGRTRALVRIAAAIAIGATSTTMESLTDSGLSAGVTDEQIIATLIAVGPVVGSARVVAAAPRLARAVGYDVDRALESHD